MKSRAAVLAVLLGLAGRLDAQPLGPAFRVNTHTTNSQAFSDVSLDDSGRSVVVWQSQFQDGSIYGVGVYGQRFAAAGGPLGTEFRVNTTTARDQSYPQTASGADGSFVVVWQSPDNTQCCGIFGQRFGAAGQAVGAEFRANLGTTGLQVSAKAAMDSAGNFVVAWLSTRQDNFGPIGVFARRFDRLGAPLAPEFRVSTDDYIGGHALSLDSDASGNFVVAWLENTAQPRRLLGRRFASNGAPQGAEFEVDTSSLGTDAEYSEVARAPSGEFVVTWGGGFFTANSDVFAQRFSSAGVPAGQGFRVNTHTTNGQFGSDVAIGAAGVFLVGWRGFNEGAFGQFFEASGEPLGGDFWMPLGWTPLGGVSLGASVSGHFVATQNFYDVADDQAVFAQHLAAPLEPLGSELRVNTITTSPQTSAAVAEYGSGSSVVVWSNAAGGSTDIAAQRFSGEGTPLGGEMRVNTFTSGAQSAGSVSPLPSGGFVVVWQGPGNGDADGGVFGQLFSGAGGPVGGELRVNSSTTGIQYGPRAAPDGSGGFAVVWRETNFRVGLYVQRFSGSGARVGADFRVNTTNIGYGSGNAAIAGSSPTGFVVAWNGYYNDILGQRFSSTGAALGGEIQIDSVSAVSAAPAVTMDSEGRFVVVYSNIGDGSGSSIFARRFSASGAPLTPPFLVNSYTTLVQDSPTVASGSGGTFVVAWRSHLSFGGSSSYGVFGQLYKKTGEPATSAFRVSDSDLQEAPAVALGKGLTFTWQRPDTSSTGIYSQRFETPCRSSDQNGDGQINVSDVLYLINALFAGGPAPLCGGDANGDGNANVSDVLFLINHLFAGGPPPVSRHLTTRDDALPVESSVALYQENVAG